MPCSAKSAASTSQAVVVSGRVLAPTMMCSLPSPSCPESSARRSGQCAPSVVRSAEFADPGNGGDVRPQLGHAVANRQSRSACPSEAAITASPIQPRSSPSPSVSSQARSSAGPSFPVMSTSAVGRGMGSQGRGTATHRLAAPQADTAPRALYSRRRGGDLFRAACSKVGAWPKSGEAREETQKRFARIGYQAGIIEFLKVSVMNLLTSSEW